MNNKLLAFITFLSMILLLQSCSQGGLRKNRIKSAKNTASITKYKTKRKGIDRRNGVRLGEASFYGPGFHGRKTANGERFNQYAMTAAHRSLPFNTIVKVTEVETKNSVVVRINDRGPFAKNRIIDLSVAAARKIGMIRKGHAYVRLDIIKMG